MSEPNILPLRFWDDPVLSKVCDKIEDNEFGPQLVEFGQQLIATMHSKDGVGLAAPQVGVTKQIFAMDFPDHKDVPAIVVCNPVLVISGNAIPGMEGCLSLPGLREQVKRASHVNMRYCQPDGKEIELILDLMDARVAQHEWDHLNGIMFFDFQDKRPEPYGARMSKQTSKRVLRQWDKQKGKT